MNDECRFSHGFVDKQGVDLVGVKEHAMLTKYFKENPPRATSRSTSRTPNDGSFSDAKGMCWAEKKGKEQCTDPDCIFIHRRPDFKSKNPKARKATPEELANLPK